MVGAVRGYSVVCLGNRCCLSIHLPIDEYICSGTIGSSTRLRSTWQVADRLWSATVDQQVSLVVKVAFKARVIACPAQDIAPLLHLLERNAQCSGRSNLSIVNSPSKGTK
jgi:hypothetical protein